MIPVANIPKVRTLKYMQQVLANYEGRFLKFKEKNGSTTYFVSVDFDEWYFDSKGELLKWASVYFWNRDMKPAIN